MNEPVRRLQRSRHNRMLGGVCAGLAEYLGLDVTLVRLLYVVGSIVSVAFPGILVYILLLFIMPMESDDDPYRPE
jgi:phage shock protein C